MARPGVGVVTSHELAAVQLLQLYPYPPLPVPTPTPTPTPTLTPISTLTPPSTLTPTPTPTPNLGRREARRGAHARRLRDHRFDAALATEVLEQRAQPRGRPEQSHGNLRVQRPCTRAQRLGGLRWREGRLRGSEGLAALGGGRRGTERVTAVAEGAGDSALVESTRVHAA